VIVTIVVIVNQSFDTQRLLMLCVCVDVDVLMLCVHVVSSSAVLVASRLCHSAALASVWSPVDDWWSSSS